jgi:hypothetical protein
MSCLNPQETLSAKGGGRWVFHAKEENYDFKLKSLKKTLVLFKSIYYTSFA